MFLKRLIKQLIKTHIMKKQQLIAIQDRIIDDVSDVYVWDKDYSLFKEGNKKYIINININTKYHVYSLCLNRFCTGFKNIENAFENMRFIGEDDNIIIVDNKDSIDYISFDDVESLTLKCIEINY